MLVLRALQQTGAQKVVTPQPILLPPPQVSDLVDHFVLLFHVGCKVIQINCVDVEYTVTYFKGTKGFALEVMLKFSSAETSVCS